MMVEELNTTVAFLTVVGDLGDVCLANAAGLGLWARLVEFLFIYRLDVMLLNRVRRVDAGCFVPQDSRDRS